MSEHTWVVVMVGVVGLVVVVKVVDSVQREHPPHMSTKDVQAPPAPLHPGLWFQGETAKAWQFARLQNNVLVRVVVARVDNVVMFVIVVVVDVVVALRIPTC